ncbi:hypothetical protein G6321_00021710 [Bradyrhizobium barranii subsp. barranii]|uniref:Uncharacterized protein n=1 Tax=Bradyrhizobium barranii subsp. barranii TaxID=2823807 RepID=A0A9X9Z351_9BRAD|nr:hypothetical protein [Bradyrhizobium barranii]UGX97606.1 hypothetical protein G6321_00021710 [Bradyrhizobium barranii subsp. barranii]
MPQVEFIKTLGVEARLRQTVTEAVATLATVRRLAEISARASYLTIAWGNRLGTPSVKDKQSVLDDIDAQLSDLKVTPEERSVIVKPWVGMIRADFFFLYSRVVREFAALKASDLTAKIHATQSREATDASMAHSDLITPWSEQTNKFGAMERLETKSLSSVIDEYMPAEGGWLTDKELSAFQAFKGELVRLNDDCAKKGGYTAEAANYYDQYAERQNDKEKAKQLWEASR